MKLIMQTANARPVPISNASLAATTCAMINHMFTKNPIKGIAKNMPGDLAKPAHLHVSCHVACPPKNFIPIK